MPKLIWKNSQPYTLSVSIQRRYLHGQTCTSVVGVTFPRHRRRNSNGSPGKRQWSNTHSGNAFPPVCWRKSANPKGLVDRHVRLQLHHRGPGRCSSARRVHDDASRHRNIHPSRLVQVLRMSTRKTRGSSKRGEAVELTRVHDQHVVGKICPIPRWIASACSTTSKRLIRKPCMFLHNTPSLRAHWNFTQDGIL
jgi:hypothetical protein